MAKKRMSSKGDKGIGCFVFSIIGGMFILAIIYEWIKQLINSELFNNSIMIIVLVISILIALISSYNFKKSSKENKELKESLQEIEEWKKEISSKYDGIIDTELEKKKLKEEVSSLEIKKEDISQKVEILKKEIVSLTDENNLLEFGFYEFRYNFERSEDYNYMLEMTKSAQKSMLMSKTAAICETEWIVEGSKKDGKKITDNILKLALRAFNGESDAAISKVKFNNIQVMETRIKKSFENINKMISYFNCFLSEEYYKLKIEELQLTYEYYKVLEAEKEEQRRIKEEMREEEKAQRELEKAKLEAEKEEQRARKALEKAEEKLKTAHGEEINKMNEEIEKLKLALEEAKKNQERAKSMAQMTKSGYVYVISNIGSFGENIYKIGMTRRLEPMDRVRELGDASVPFNFDVHAMIFSENAPQLETNLHKEFYNNRVNKMNDRREFFKVELDKIKEIAEKYKANVKFTMIAEAEQYRQTLALEKEMKQNQK